MTNTLDGLTIEQWRYIAHKMCDYLDNVDTFSDAFRPEQTPYYEAVMREVMKRHEWLHSDGWTLQPMPNLEFNFEEEAAKADSPIMVRNMSGPLPPDQGEQTIHVGIDLARHEAGLPPA